VRASAVVFDALKIAGALYLVWLGVQAIRAARQALDEAPPTHGGPVGAATGFRHGLLSDLANPKIGIFFTSLLPQFVDPGRPVLLPFLVLGAIFVVMTAVWLVAYTLMAVRASAALRRPSVKAAMDRITGTVLIALGLRLATERG